MCLQEGIALDEPESSAVSAEFDELHRTAERLRDLASYLANHELEHEAAYVMMAFKRVYARLARVALKSCPEPSVAA